MTKLDMVCSCGDNDKDVEADYRQWYRNLEEHDIIKDDDIRIDGLIMDLQSRYYGILKIISDQWFGVSYDFDYEGAKDNYYVECDRIQDGIIAIFKELYGKYGKSRYTD